MNDEHIGLLVDDDSGPVLTSARKSSIHRIQSDQEIYDTLLEEGYLVHILTANYEGSFGSSQNFTTNRIKAIVNLACSGLPSEPKVAKQLEILGIPFTGSNSTAIRLTNDKYKSLNILAAQSIPAVETVHLNLQKRRKTLPFQPPFFVKPKQGGSSIGVCKASLCESIPAVYSYAEHVFQRLSVSSICQPFITGRDLTVGYLSVNGHWKLLGATEWVFPEGPSGFRNESVRNSIAHRQSRKIITKRASLEKLVLNNLNEIGSRALDALGVTGYASIDYRLDSNGPAIIEVNSNPGLSRKHIIWGQPLGQTLRNIISAALDSK